MGNERLRDLGTKNLAYPSPKVVRETIKDVFDTYNKFHKLKRRDGIFLTELEGISQLMEQRARQARKEFGVRLHCEATIVKLMVFAISSLAMRWSEQERPVVPAGWAGRPTIQVHTVFESLFVQIANHALAVLQLTRVGLDNPARAVLRCTLELLWQTLVIFESERDFSEYAGNEDSDDEQNWYRLFGRGKLLKKVQAIEKKYGLDFSDRLHEWRGDTYRFHSRAVHHTYVAAVVGSRAFDFDEDVLSTALFGRLSASSISTLRALAYELTYFVTMFNGILRNEFGRDLSHEVAAEGRAIAAHAAAAFLSMMIFGDGSPSADVGDVREPQ